jgi:hypothetical protein
MQYKSGGLGRVLLLRSNGYSPKTTNPGTRENSAAILCQPLVLFRPKLFFPGPDLGFCANLAQAINASKREDRRRLLFEAPLLRIHIGFDRLRTSSPIRDSSDVVFSEMRRYSQIKRAFPNLHVVGARDPLDAGS